MTESNFKTILNPKEAYYKSVLKTNSIHHILKSLTNNEVVDNNTEALLIEMADSFFDNTIEIACNLAKHKNSDHISVDDIVYAMDKKFDVSEQKKITPFISGMKTNQVYKSVTLDHKKRVELTREEYKNINID